MMLTTYSLSIALRVVREIARTVKGNDPTADMAFRIVEEVLKSLTEKYSRDAVTDVAKRR